MRNKPVDFSLTVFLRSDIFSHIQDQSGEKDKLEFARILWEDPELLMRVVNERLTFSFGKTYTPRKTMEGFHYADS